MLKKGAQGYRVPVCQRPNQPYLPRALTHSQVGEGLLQKEIQVMLEKHAIEETMQRMTFPVNRLYPCAASNTHESWVILKCWSLPATDRLRFATCNSIANGDIPSPIN